MIARYSADARRQLTDIWQFSCKRWSVGQADKYITALYETVEDVAAGKRRVRPCSEIHPGLNVVSCQSHHIYFMLDADAEVLNVVTILHQQMDAQRHIRRALKGEPRDGTD